MLIKLIVAIILYYNIHVVSSYMPYANMCICHITWWLSSKESTCKCRRCRLHPWVGKIPWRRNGNPLQNSCLGNPIDRGVWWATVQGVAKSWIQFSDYTTVYTHTHTYTQTNIFFLVKEKEKNVKLASSLGSFFYNKIFYLKYILYNSFRNRPTEENTNKK